jgi:hypothetical protein
MENKKTYIILYGAFITLIIMVVGISGLYASYSKTQAKDSGLTNAVYTCPMHPEVISDVPGDCPKCGMALVLKEDIKQSGDGCCGEKMGMDGCGKMSGHDHSTDQNQNINKDEKHQETNTESPHKGCMGH